MLRYCGPFLFLAGIPVLYYFAGPGWPLATVIALAIILIALEAGLPRPVPVRQPLLDTSRILPLLYVPLQLGVIIWALGITPQLSPSTFIGLALSVGIIAGVFGMLCAHELAHSRHPFDRFVALAMLIGMSYPQFRIAHIYGHHRWAGTERDSATAKLGQGFYAFLVRTLFDQWKESWKFERRRCSSKALSLLQNRSLQDIIAILLIYAGIMAGSGARGALFFLLESAVAIVVLELFNYIAHYGLVRGVRDDGRLQPLSDGSSWNSSNEFANLLLFNMGRHSDHHRRPAASYQLLTSISGAPELPFGYAGCILIALVPPLWRHVMDPRVLRLETRQPPHRHGRRYAVANDNPGHP
jgi:alkane 1-monooxygenase